jgi:hypothetical protein
MEATVTTSRRKSPLHSGSGAVLLIALIFMLLLSVIAATVMQSAILQLRMAGNDQFMEEALHRAQAIAAELSLNAGNFLLTGEVGDANCPQGRQDAGCDQSQLQVPASVPALDAYALDYRVVRQEPLLWRGFPIREAEHSASSSTGFDAALFEIDVQLDGSDNGLGSAHVVQGVVVRVPVMR